MLIKLNWTELNWIVTQANRGVLATVSTHPSHISDRSDKVLHQSIQVVYIDQATKGTRFMIYFKDGGLSYLERTG